MVGKAFPFQPLDGGLSRFGQTRRRKMEAEPLHKFSQLTLRARKGAQLENIGRFREGNVDVVPLGFRKGAPGPRRTQAIIKFPDFAVFQLDSTLGALPDKMADDAVSSCDDIVDVDTQCQLRHQSCFQ